MRGVPPSLYRTRLPFRTHPRALTLPCPCTTCNARYEVRELVKLQQATEPICISGHSSIREVFPFRMLPRAPNGLPISRSSSTQLRASSSGQLTLGFSRRRCSGHLSCYNHPNSTIVPCQDRNKEVGTKFLTVAITVTFPLMAFVSRLHGSRSPALCALQAI